MKKLFLFSIKQVWELIKYIKPLYEIIAAIVKIIKNDNDNENAASKREKSGARSGSSEREQGRPKVNENE